MTEYPINKILFELFSLKGSLLITLLKIIFNCFVIKIKKEDTIAKK